MWGRNILRMCDNNNKDDKYDDNNDYDTDNNKQ